MKKLYLLMLGLLACVIANAQVNNSEQPKQEQKMPEAKNVSEAQVYYAGKFEKTADLGLNLRFGFVEFGGAYQIAGEGDGWKVNLGGAYRYYFGESVFVEGAAGVYYGNSSITTRVATGTYEKKVGSLGYKTFTKYETKKDSSSGFGAYITPRLGILVSNGWGIYAAYEWDFFEFKFDNFDKRGYWKLGLVIPL